MLRAQTDQGEGYLAGGREQEEGFSSLLTVAKQQRAQQFTATSQVQLIREILAL